jgi:hypothetical protein
MSQIWVQAARILRPGVSLQTTLTVQYLNQF